MSVPSALQNFPNLATYHTHQREYNRMSDLMDWDWNYSGHNPPETIDDNDGGSMTLGSGDATSGSYLNGQCYGSNIKLNRLAKLYEFSWTLALNSGTLTGALIGINSTNTNMLSTCIADGFGFYINGPSGPAAGTWVCYNVKGGVVQYTDYQGYSAGSTYGTGDTGVHTFSIKIITDPTTLGSGAITFYIDGNQIGNGLSGSIITQQALRNSIALRNSSGVAQSIVLYQDILLGQR